MSRTQRRDLLSEIQVGDFCQYGNSTDVFYEVIDLNHPAYGSTHLKLRTIYHGHHDSAGTFEFEKIRFNHEFSQIYRKSNDRALAKLAHVLALISAAGEGEVIQNLLVEVDV